MKATSGGEESIMKSPMTARVAKRSVDSKVSMAHLRQESSLMNLRNNDMGKDKDMDIPTVHMGYTHMSARTAMASTAALATQPFPLSIDLFGTKTKALKWCSSTRRELDNKESERESSELNAKNATCHRLRCSTGTIIEYDCRKEYHHSY
jgi:hypothetical protein